MKLNLQLFGGDGGSSHVAGGGSASGGISKAEAEKKIDNGKFYNQGKNYQMDIDGVGGAFIHDETENMLGTTDSRGKYYTITLWDGNYNEYRVTYDATSLSEAKSKAKQALKNGFGNPNAHY